MYENQLAGVVECGKEFLKGYTGPRYGSQAYKVMNRVLSYAEENLSDSDSVEFTWKDIAERHDYDSDGKAIKQSLANLIQSWPSHADLLSEIADKKSLSFIPMIKKCSEGAGAGVMNRYSLYMEPLIKKELNVEAPKGYIRYKLELIEKPNWFGRIFNNLLMKGWVKLIVNTTISFSILIGLFVLYLGMWSLYIQDSTFGILKTLINFLFSMSALYLVFSPLYFCITRRMIMAPIIMTPFDLQSAQLEYVNSNVNHVDGKPFKQFRLVSYVSDCQLCGSKVILDKGKNNYRGRILGYCNDNPQEHIYTFDQTTRLGRLIYPEYASLVDQDFSLRK